MKINTDEEISGFGEAGIAYDCIGASAAYGIIKDIAKLLIGKNPMNTESIWNMLQKRTFWGQTAGPIISSGLSASDMALWDIKGKYYNAPLYQLLGGKCRESLRTYASQIHSGWVSIRKALSHPDEYAQAALEAVEGGYDCIKVDPLTFNNDRQILGWDLNGLLSYGQMTTGYNRLEAIRKAVGPAVDIIVELHALTDANTAVQFGRAIEDLNIFMLEEPVMPINPKMMKFVKDNVKIPIASGERIYTWWSYVPFFEDRSLSIAQPDFCTCGGVSEGKKIYDMAHAYDIAIQGHVCGGPIATAVALHIEAAIPNFIIHEHHRMALMDHIREICTYDYQPVKGKFQVTELPGIGQELTREAMENASEKLELSESNYKAMGAFGGGVSCEHLCGAISGGVAAISTLINKGDEESLNLAKEKTVVYFNGMKEAFGSVLCADIMPVWRKEDTRCFAVVHKASQLLDEILNKEKNKFYCSALSTASKPVRHIKIPVAQG